MTGKGSIKYYYDATGNKLGKRTTDNTGSSAKATVTTYLGNAVYRNDTLQFFVTSEGRVRPNTAKTDWVCDYFLKDHLGNTRMVITDDYNVASPILEANSYYPFGLQQKGIGVAANSPLHNYKNTFQKQEFNEDLGVNMYEFKYRMDDPQIGRFWQVDPLADKYVYNSTYAFSENKLTGGIELEGAEYLSTVKKYPYEGSLSDIPSAIDNGGINLVNGAISIWNSGVNTVKSISNGTLGKDLMREFNAIGNSIKSGVSNTINYTLNTPIGKQFSDAAKAIASPETLENMSSFTFGLGVGKMVSGISSFSVKEAGASSGMSDFSLANAAKGGEMTVYRVFGGDARAEGFSWTTTHPNSVSDFRNLAGLPSGGASGATNTAEFMLQGKVNFNDIIKFRTALPLDGNIGGLPEYIINPQNVRITNFSVLKP